MDEMLFETIFKLLGTMLTAAKSTVIMAATIIKNRMFFCLPLLLSSLLCIITSDDARNGRTITENSPALEIFESGTMINEIIDEVDPENIEPNEDIKIGNEEMNGIIVQQVISQNNNDINAVFLFITSRLIRSELNNITNGYNIWNINYIRRLNTNR